MNNQNNKYKLTEVNNNPHITKNWEHGPGAPVGLVFSDILETPLPLPDLVIKYQIPG